MSRSDYGATAEIISKVTDPNQLTQMLKNPQYAGFTNVIIARLTEINRMKQAAEGAAPAQPTIAQQALQGAQQQQQAPQAQAPMQAMAAGGIVAFKHGGKVRGFDEGGLAERWGALQAQKEKEENVDTEGYVPDMNASPLSRWWSKQQYASGKRKAAADAAKPLVTPTAIAPATGVAGLPAADVPPTPSPYRSGAITDPARALGGIGGGWRARDSSSDRAPRADTDTDSEAIYNRMKKRLGEAPAEAPDNNFNLALIRAGLGMAQDASVNPLHGGLGNMAAGALGGLDSYTKGAAANQAHKQELAKAARVERMGIGTLAEQEYAANKRANAAEYAADRRADAAEMGANYRTSAGNKQFELEHQMALKLADEMKRADARSPGGIKMGDMEYLAAARGRVISGQIASTQRADTARAHDRMLSSQKLIASGTLTPAELGYHNMIIANNGVDPNEGSAGSGRVLPR